MKREVIEIEGVQQKSAVHIVRCRYGFVFVTEEDSWGFGMNFLEKA